MRSSVTRVVAAAGTDVGRVRQGNEDSFYSGHHVFAVADGMGGHRAGEVASALALEPVAELDDHEFEKPVVAGQALVSAIEEANRVVVERSQSDDSLQGMGTTLTAVLVHGDQLLAAHVGDSRAYLLRPGEGLSQLTTDHTLVERLVQEGRLSRDQVGAHPQRNVITRAIGNEPKVAVDALPPLRLQPGDQVLLCSDGLTGPLDDEDIQTLIDVTGGGQDAVDALIAAANEAGGPDNITVVLLEVAGGEAAAAATDAAATTSEPTMSTPAAPPPETDRSHDGARPPIDVREGHEAPAHEHDADWATEMGRLSGREEPQHKPSPTSRGKRILAGVLGAVVLLAIAVGGAYFLLSRAYFVGDHDGFVAVHRGLPETVGGVPLYWVLDDEVSDLRVSELPPFRQTDIEEGLSAGTLREAQQVVEGLRRLVEEEGGATPAPSPAPPPTPTPLTEQNPGVGT